MNTSDSIWYVSSYIKKLRGGSHSISASMKIQIEILRVELSSLELVLWCTGKLNDDSSLTKREKEELAGFADHISRIDGTLKKNVLAIKWEEFKEFDTLSSELLLNIRLFKLALIKEPHSFLFSNSLSRCKFYNNNLQWLVIYTRDCLDDFLCLNGDHLIPDKKVKIRSLKEDIDFLQKVLESARKWGENHVKMETFKIQSQAWASDAACFSLLNWILYDKDDNADILSDLLNKLKIALPELTRTCLAFLIMGLELPSLLTIFVDYLFQKLQVHHLPSNDVEKLRNGMELFIKFLKNHSDGEIILAPLTANLIPSIELVSLMDHILVLLRIFLVLEGALIPDNKAKIKSLIGDMAFLKAIFQRCGNRPEMKDLKIQIQAWTFDAVFLCLQICIQDEKDENMEPATNLILSDLLQKLNTALPGVTRMSLAALTASKPSHHDENPQVIGRFVTRFEKFLLGNMQVDLSRHDVGKLQNEMKFLIKFLVKYENDVNCNPDIELVRLMDHTQVLLHNFLPLKGSLISDEKAKFKSLIGDIDLLKQIFHFTSKRCKSCKEMTAWAFNVTALCLQLRIQDDKDENMEPTQSVLLSDFLQKLNTALPEITWEFLAALIASKQSEHDEYLAVGTLVMSFVDFLIRTLQVDLPMDYIEMLQNGIRFLIMFHIEEPDQKYANDGKLVSTEIATTAKDVVASLITSLCAGKRNTLLLDFLGKVKALETEVKRTKERHLHGIDALSTESNLSPGALLQTDVQSMDDLVVGFEDEVKEITDWLRSGSRQLDILSIIGMAGMGKTTLAKKVYDDPSIKHYFTKYAWCTVSQSYNCKKLLLDILKDVTLVDDSFFKMEEGDLAHKLKKCLNGQKYLIVMDDMWDIGAWNALKLSFPNDKKGSRIVFTSRIHNVASKAKSDSRPYPLSSLTEEKSWKLLEKRLFHKRSCPRNFVEVGKKIARDCKGLPLAIVLVAGILKEKLQNLDWWKQIGKNLGSRISQEGCAIVIEQSYKHLSEPLKPCFLYFGSFREDKVIRVQKLIELWVSEGFIEKHEVENLETVAAEYLMDLVARSLVVVTERSSSGGIKSCQIHDLLWEFCLAKAEEENFSHVLRGNDNSRVSRTTLDEHYRVCIQSKDWTSFMSWNSSALQSLLFSPTATYNLSDVQYLSVENSKFLQVLDLEDVVLFGEFPKSVTKLILLRYMAIRCTARSIPPEISKLLILETFCVRRSQYGLRLPETMFEMEKLRHVDVGHCLLPELCDNSVILENIQSFSFPCLTCGEQTKTFLRKIAKVRKLKCEFKPKRQDNQILKLDFLEKLESLNTTCMPKNLGSCPFSFPSNLKKLTLKDFGIPWIEISTITTMLPNLEVLKLLKNAFSGKAWTVGDGEFPKLKFLKLQALGIEQWDASEESFPFLEELVVDKCHKFERFPSEFGNNVYLRKIQVEWCRSTVAESAMQIQEDLVELGNADLKVIIGRFSDAK